MEAQIPKSWLLVGGLSHSQLMQRQFSAVGTLRELDREAAAGCALPKRE
jgi:hypothetical protein